MPVTATTSEEIFVGAGEVYVDGASVGATMENNVFRVTREYFTPELNGVRGPLLGIDYIQSEIAELEVSIPEISASKLALIVPGSTSTTSATTVTAGGATTTLAADAAAGATNIKVTAITGMTVGDWLRLGAAGGYQYAKIITVGTLGAGGTGVTLDRPLVNAVANTGAVVEVDGNGETIITSGTQRRLPSSAYHDWALAIPGLDGREARFELDNAIMTDNPEFEAADDGALAPRLTLQSRWDPANPNVAPWRIKRSPAIV